jgi:hypothetical protein
MAFKKIQHELLEIAERCDRRGKHELAEKIRETVEGLRWSGFNSKITLAFDLALESKRNATFNSILPRVASYSGYSVDELRNILHIQEYFEYAKRIEKRRATRERELQRHLVANLHDLE